MVSVMGKAYFTCKCGCRVEYETDMKTRPKYCQGCMRRMVDILVSIDAEAESFHNLFAPVGITKDSKQVRL